MIHTALIHDDIIDKSDLRRGKNLHLENGIYNTIILGITS